MISIGSFVGVGQGFSLVVKFCHLAIQKKGLVNSTKGFFRIKFFLPSLKKKKVRSCQNYLRNLKTKTLVAGFT
jgi:hypothetical protein